ncbi:MAG: amidohydrolase family protein [Desulfobacterales bacterium]|nr:amidohydrolase family protein [Desulfobacterales bacterium]
MRIIDVHTHIFPKEIRTRREAYFSDEPEFKKLYQSPKSRLIGAQEMLAAMGDHQVERSVIFGFPWKDPQLFKKHNDYIIAVVKRYPDRFIGLGCFDLFCEDAAAETQRCLEQGGLSGIGELAFYQSGIDHTALDRLAPVMDICRDGDLPVLIHTNEPIGHAYPGKTPNTLAQIYRLIDTFPQNKILLAHWGGGLFFFSLLKKEVKERLTHVYFDTAASPYLYDPKVYRLAIDLVGVKKILFGSDYPLLPPARYIDEMQTTGLSKSEMRQICGLNAAKLFNL